MEIHGRYGRPVLLAETGIEFDARPAWLRYVAAEVELARAKGVPMEGLCLYPVLNHFGWDSDRPCQNGSLELGGGAAGEPSTSRSLTNWQGLQAIDGGIGGVGSIATLRGLAQELA